MSETRLNINLSATNTASASIKELQAAVKGLEGTLRELGNIAASASAAASSSIQREIVAIRQKIAALQDEIAVKRASSAEGIREARANAEAENRNTDQINRRAQSQIRARNAVARAERQAIEDTARFEAETANAATNQREANLRRDMAAHNARVYQARALEDAQAATVYSMMREKADVENAAFDNRRATTRKAAEDENAAFNVRAANARAAAAYTNQDMNLVAAKQAAEEAAMRRRADLENAEFDRIRAAQARSAAGIISRASPSAAAGAAAAAATLRGAAPSVVSAEATVAATAALERQQAAIRAVAAAMTAAGRAGATAQEIQMAAINAATMALRTQAATAESAGIGTILQRESRHIIGLFDSLARGQRGQAISSIGAGARDAGLGIMGLSAAMVGLVAVMGTEAILHHAEALGKWATEAKAAASATGMGVQQYTQFQGALRITGLSANEADSTLRHFAQTLSTAIQDPTSKAAEAFHNLGISQNEIAKTGGDTAAGLKLMADAWSRTADSANKAANGEEIFGRGLERITPLLNKGHDGLEALQRRAEELGLTLTEKTAASLEQTGEKARELGLKISGEVTQAFIAWGPVIEGLIAILNGLGTVLSTIIVKLGEFVSAGAAAFGRMQQIEAEAAPFAAATKIDMGGGGGGKPFATTGQKTAEEIRNEQLRAQPRQALPLVEPTSALQAMRDREEALAEIASRGAKKRNEALKLENQARIAEIQRTLKEETLQPKQREDAEKELRDRIMALRHEQLAGSGGAANKQETRDYIADARLRIAEANGNSQKIAAIYDEEIAKLRQLAAAHKATAAQISNAEREKVLAVNRARLDEVKEGARLEEQQNRLLKLNTSLAQMAAGTFKYAGQKEGPGAEQQRQQEFLAEAAQVHASAQKEIADLQAIADAAGEGTTIQKQAQAEIMSVLLQSKQQEVELYKKAGDAAVAAANKLTATFQSMFDKIGADAETFGKDLVSALIAPQKEVIKAGLGSKTISQQGDQIRAAIGHLMGSIAETIGKSLMTALSKSIANALSGGAANTMGELLSRWLQKGISSIVGGTAGEAGSKAISGAAGSALGGAGGGAALTTAGTTLTTAGATLSTAGAALNTAAAALSTASAAGGVGAAGGAAAASATEATTISAAITAGDATIVGAIGASTTAIVTAITALTLKPSVLGTTFASGGIVPSAEGGMVGGMGATLSILHAREMVLPAPISTGLQQMIARGNTGSGGGTNNMANLNFSPTINTGAKGRGGTGMTRSEFGQMLSLHSGSMLGEARNMMRNGWRPSAG
jgi:hypothetical protein